MAEGLGSTNVSGAFRALKRPHGVAIRWASALVTPLLCVNGQFAGAPTFQCSPLKAGKSDQTFPSPEHLATQDNT